MSAAMPASPPSRVHLPSLIAALLIMVAGTTYPLLMANGAGKADHALAMALFWAMSAGFTRGVGFVPRLRAWRWLLSGWACIAALSLALILKLHH